MTEQLHRLRAIAGEVAVDDYHGAVEVCEAILRLKEGDVVATRRLAPALVKLGELDRAEEIVQEALVLHPEDNILLNRAKDIAFKRRQAAKVSSAGKGAGLGNSADAVPSTWIKAVHYDGGGWDERPGDETWLSDPGQRNAQGERLYTAAGDPWGRPSWRVGEQVGVYFGGTHRVPVLAEIISPPEFKPRVRAGRGLGPRGRRGALALGHPVPRPQDRRGRSGPESGITRYRDKLDAAASTPSHHSRHP